MIDTDKCERHFVDSLVAVREGGVDCDFSKIRIEDALADMSNLVAEVKQLRELLYKCWKDSGQSLYYLQVELLNDKEHWYQKMMCEDGSCEDCEVCGFPIDPDNEVYSAGSECICDLKEMVE